MYVHLAFTTIFRVPYFHADNGLRAFDHFPCCKLFIRPVCLEIESISMRYRLVTNLTLT